MADYLAALLLSIGQADDAKIPHQDNETTLVRIKASPEKYVGKEFIICGGLQVDDYYNYGYNGAIRRTWQVENLPHEFGEGAA